MHTATATQGDTVTSINMQPASSYRTDNYGVLLESATVHQAQGRGLHNPAFNHAIEVWENRPGLEGHVVTPHGEPTDEAYTVLLTAKASVLSAHPGQPLTQGDTLHVGDTVQLTVNGYAIGTYRIEARSLRDPELVKVA